MGVILSSQQTKELDAATAKMLNISSFQLMERAVEALFVQITNLFPNKNKCHFYIFAGPGNNGGDGLGLALKMLENGYSISIWQCYDNKISDNNRKYLNILSENYKNLVFTIEKDNLQNINFSPSDVVIDALFGIGLNRVLSDNYAEVVRFINKSMVKVISIDIPSGVFTDYNTQNQSDIVCADTTLVIRELPFVAMFPENHKYFGNIKIVDIGHISPKMANIRPCYTSIDENDIIPLQKLRLPFDHKGTFGHAMLIAGSKGMAGAATIAAKACLRSGVGLLSIQVPCLLANILQVAVPEAMLKIDTNSSFITNILDYKNYSAIGIGPGIGKNEETCKVVEMVITSNKPIVVDADALNILSEHKEWYNKLNNCILTPHPKEFERLFGNFSTNEKRLAFMSDFAKSHNSCIVFKGGITTIALPDGEIAFYVGKNPAIATGGSGDALTGIITSLLAQNYTITEAAKIGIWVHGEAGKAAALYYGCISTISTDIISYLPEAFKYLYEAKFNNSERFY